MTKAPLPPLPRISRPRRPDWRPAIAGELFPVGTPIHVGCGGEVLVYRGDRRGRPGPADVCALCGEVVAWGNTP